MRKRRQGAGAQSKKRKRSRLKAKMDTYILDEVLAEKREKREKIRRQQVKKVFAALDKLAGVVDFQEAYIFGSLARPYAFNPESDVDIGFSGLKDEDFFKTIAFLSNVLGREVDVIQLEGHRLKNKILREGIRWRKHSWPS